MERPDATDNDIEACVGQNIPSERGPGQIQRLISPIHRNFLDLRNKPIESISLQPEPGGVDTAFSFRSECPSFALVEQYPAPLFLSGRGVNYLVHLRVEDAGFDFLSFEYRVPREAVSRAARLTLHVFARSDDGARCHVGIGAKVAGDRFEYMMMRPVQLRTPFTDASISVPVDVLPLNDVVGETLSLCLLFEKRRATAAFAFHATLSGV